MKILFSSDLHGNDAQYAKLFLTAAEQQVDTVIIGGDLAPKGIPADAYIETQRQWYPTLAEHIAQYHRLCERMHERSHTPGRVLAMMGNDDARCNLPELRAALDKHGASNINMRRERIGNAYVIGYSSVPPTPFSIKDWERFDFPQQSENAMHWVNVMGMRMFATAGYLSSREGWQPQQAIPRDKTIASDIASPLFMREPRKTVYAFHAPPAMTALDITGSKRHVGSAAIREFIEERQPLITLHGHIHETLEMSGQYREQVGRTWCYASGNAPEEKTLSAILIDTDRPGDGKRLRL